MKKEPTVRIGNKDKSVSVKRYFLEFWMVAMGLEMYDAKKQAKKELEHGLEVMPSEFVTADYVSKRMLTYVLESERFQD